MKLALVALVTFFMVPVFAQKSNLINDPNAVLREVGKGFTAIKVSSGIDLYLSQSDAEAVAVSASDEKYLEGLKTEVVNGMLKIYYENKGIKWTGGNKKKLKAYVSVIILNRLVVSAGSNALVSGVIKTDKLNLEVNSGAEFKGELAARELVADVNSGAGIKVSGTTGQLQVNASSGAGFWGYNLTTDYCSAKASSGASVQIKVNREIGAHANSGGNIRYKGDAVIKDVKINSGGSIKKI